MRGPNHIDRMLAAVRVRWQRTPELNLCELLGHVSEGHELFTLLLDCLRLVDDKDLLKWLEQDDLPRCAMMPGHRLCGAPASCCLRGQSGESRLACEECAARITQLAVEWGWSIAREPLPLSATSEVPR